ncbi:beta-galactosidase GalB [Croceitalea marina]|uniref:Beta-galactosidase GalB n=1 Tax=Croceitalea marina TaxID=1775166 RepID=A0ABW5N068_9FLAO
MMRKSFERLLYLVVIAVIILSCSQKVEVDYIADQNFNQNWLFNKGDVEEGQAINLKDEEWRKLNLPHDWAIEGPFDSKYNARTGGLPVHGVGWYRKHFTVPKEHKNKQISIEFDGAMNNAKVWLNGNFIGERPYGYIGFEFDLTPYIKFGEDNIIAVKLAPEDLAARWYTGAGIYRNVRLKINHATHIPQWGVRITTPSVQKDSATVNVVTTIKNVQDDDVEASLITTLKDGNGNKVASNEVEVLLNASSEEKINQEIKIENPELWGIYQPNLYKAESRIVIKSKIVDDYSSEFGIRTIALDQEKGFLLNGNPIKFNGVCLHHDQGPLGAAINYRAKERQMEIMKEMGVNALRTSHNPPSPELLQVCDRLGIVVIDEAFDEWQMGKVPNGYSKYFDKWHEKDLRDMIRRDINHPSVVMYSIGNEILEQGKKDGWKLTKHLNDICHDEDSTRPTTIGFNFYPAPFENRLADQVDVVGMNYKPMKYAEAKALHPNMFIYGSETSSQTSSRGAYHFPLEAKTQKNTLQVSGYDVTTGPAWAYAPDIEFDMQEQNKFSLGEFIWTGFDYLGEPTPYGGRDNSTNGYWNDDWPSRSSYFAPVDLCGFKKDRFYLYQSQWTEEPMVHLLPHWNWTGKEGQEIPVVSYTNCDWVELFVNEKSYGIRKKGVDTTTIPADLYHYDKDFYESKYRLSWTVPYQKGKIKVVGYKDGKAVVQKEINTAGKPSRIKLSADRNEINKGGEDISYITVRVEDSEGNLCPLADNLIDFEVEGAGSILAVGNGNAASLESFQDNKRKAFNGLALLVVKSNSQAGTIKIKGTSKGLKPANLVVNVN